MSCTQYVRFVIVRQTGLAFLNVAFAQGHLAYWKSLKKIDDFVMV